jgi:hypothetical protein
MLIRCGETEKNGKRRDNPKKMDEEEEERRMESVPQAVGQCLSLNR